MYGTFVNNNRCVQSGILNCTVVQATITLRVLYFRLSKRFLDFRICVLSKNRLSFSSTAFPLAGVPLCKKTYSTCLVHLSVEWYCAYCTLSMNCTSIVCTGLYRTAHFRTVCGIVDLCSKLSTEIQQKKFDTANVRSRSLQSSLLSH
jgi:hypothetical protein